MEAFRNDLQRLYRILDSLEWVIPDDSMRRAFAPVRWALIHQHDRSKMFDVVIREFSHIANCGMCIIHEYYNKSDNKIPAAKTLEKEDYAYVAYFTAPLQAYLYLNNTPPPEEEFFRDWLSVGHVLQKAKLWGKFSEGVCAFPDKIKE